MTTAIRYASTLAIAVVLLACTAHGGTYTAVKSGYWSGDSTWGKTPPSFHLSADTIVIPAGIAVTLDVDGELDVDDPEALLTVNGSLSHPPYYTEGLIVRFGRGTIDGTGKIFISTLHLFSTSRLIFNGSILAYAVRIDERVIWPEFADSSEVHLVSSIQIIRSLYLTHGTLVVDSGGKLELWSGSKIVLSNGHIDTNGGILAFQKTHGVVYTYSLQPRTPGIELSGYPRQGFTVDGAKVVLHAHLDVSSIGLNRGVLDLNGFNLTVDYIGREQYSQAELISTSASNITIKRSSSRAIEFRGVDNAVRKLTLTSASNDTVYISGIVTVMDTLRIAAGTLRMDGGTLTLRGQVAGPGAIRGDTNLNLVVLTPTGLLSGLRFSPGGELLRSLTIDLGTTNTVTLVSDLKVWKSTSLISGNLDIRNVYLTLRGSFTGDGDLLVNEGSGLSINTSHGFTDPLRITGRSIGSFLLDVPLNQSVPLGGDLTVIKNLNLKRGTLALNGHDLTIAGTFRGDSGALHSTASSDIAILTPTSDTARGGFLRFSGVGNAVRVLVIDIGHGNRFLVGGDITVQQELRLTSGRLYGYDKIALTINGTVSGVGELSGSVSMLTINTEGGFTKGLNFTDYGIGHLVVNVGAESSVKFLHKLAIGELELKRGYLDIRDIDFTLYGNIVGDGSIIINDKSHFIVETNHGIDKPLPLIGDSLGGLTISTDSNRFVKLANNLVVTKELRLYRGTLVLNGYDLTTLGQVSRWDWGCISSTAGSNIVIAGNVSRTALAFDRYSNEVNNFTIALDSGAVCTVESDLSIEGSLTLSGGRLYVPDAVLSVQRSSSIIGASTSRYIMTLFDGSLEMEVVPGVQSVFPVGTIQGIFPCSLLVQENSQSSKIRVGVRSTIFDKVTQSPIATKTFYALESVSWLVSSSTNPTIQIDLQVGWHQAAERSGFDRSRAYIAKLQDLRWDVSSTSPATSIEDSMFSIQRHNIRGLGQFAVFGVTPTDITDDYHFSRPASVVGCSVYPSPATDFITIDNPRWDGSPVHVDIIDAQGQCVTSCVFDRTNNVLSVVELVRGQYFVRVTYQNTTSTARFVKI